MRDSPSLWRSANRGLFRLVAVFAVVTVQAACTRSAEDHLGAARDAKYLGDIGEALKHYELALQVAARGDCAQAERVRATALREAADTCYLELHDTRRAAALYRDLIQGHPDAAETFGARIQLAQILRADLHDLRGAVAELAAAVARQPSRSAHLRYEMAKLYFELADYGQCALESDAIVQGDGASDLAPQATFLKAQALAMIEGRSSEAIRAFEELVERFPSSDLAPHALYELGRMLADSGELEAAIEQWVRALKTHPSPGSIQSTILRARKRLEQASSVRDRVAAAVVANAVFGGLSGLRADSHAEP